MTQPSHLPHRSPIARFRRNHRGDSHRLTASEVLPRCRWTRFQRRYGPESIVLGLVAAGAAAVSWTVPISIAIALLLLVLVISYRQVIAVHPGRRRFVRGGQEGFGPLAEPAGRGEPGGRLRVDRRGEPGGGRRQPGERVSADMAHHARGDHWRDSSCCRDQSGRHRGVGEGADGSDARCSSSGLRDHHFGLANPSGRAYRQ